MQPNTFGGLTFNCGPRYNLVKLLGAGAYGHVVLAYDLQNKNAKVAIKLLNKIDDDIDAKRVLREIKILRTMQHPHLLKLFHIIYEPVPKQPFGNIYLVTPHYPADLYKIIRSKQELTVEHIQFIMYQLCKGLHYLHSSGTIHRDIKPGNILANENTEVCFCDFGFARKFEQEQAEDSMTEYVVTRHYRAPEIMLSSQQYSKPVDVWSLGCTFAELITGKILFNGQNYIQMIKMIFDALGKPDEEEMKQFVNNENAKSFLDTLPNKPRQKISKSICYNSPKALDLLDRMLELNPNKRITIDQCLEHPFFESIRVKADETVFEDQFVCNFENDEITTEQLKELILREVNIFRKQNQEQEVNILLEMQRLRLIQKELDELRCKNSKKAQ